MIYRILLLTLLVSNSFLAQSAILDSLRTEKVKGKKFIIHRVEPKETLYSVTKRYQVSIEDLKKYNPELANGLKMYDEIKVPILRKKNKKGIVKIEWSDSSFHVVKQGETLFAISRKYSISVDSLRILNDLENATLSIGDTIRLISMAQKEVEKKNDLSTDSLNFHIVKPSETLFSISRLYQVEIEDLQKWNEMADYNLSIGQKLAINSNKSDTLASAKPIIKRDSVAKKSELPVLDTLFVRTDNSQFKTRSKTVEGKKQTIEEGFAMKIEDTDYTKKYLALHRTAPLGSTILVKNQMNNVVIEARVVGKLPESALNVKLLMRLSSAAYKALGAIDLKTPVTVSFQEDE